MTFIEELDLLIRSSHPVLYIHTAEEERAEDLIAETAAFTHPARRIVTWDSADGIAGRGKQTPLEMLETISRADPDEPVLYILRDFHQSLSDQRVARRLRNLAHELREGRKTALIIAPVISIPNELEEEITVITLAHPTSDEIASEVDAALTRVTVTLPEGGRAALVEACKGLTLNRVRLALARAITAYGQLDERAITLIHAEKRERIRRTEVLEYWPAAETLDDIGGLDLLKDWLARRAPAFTEEARRYGLPNPKGLLLVGVQGTGKSLSAKATASLWRLPLLRLDVGRLMGGLVGQSEARTREMIQLAEAMAPCVLFIDEIDKAFGFRRGASGEASTIARVFSTILTWMEEKTSPVFIAATANSVDTLPVEILRKGRFDEVFFLDLPSDRERREILEVHLGRLRPSRLRGFDIPLLAFQSEGFSGAEIEQAIYEAMHRAFSERREFTSEDILAAFAETIPLSTTASSTIRRLQEWAVSGRCRPASSDTATLLSQVFKRD